MWGNGLGKNGFRKDRKITFQYRKWITRPVDLLDYLSRAERYSKYTHTLYFNGGPRDIKYYILLRLNIIRKITVGSDLVDPEVLDFNLKF